MLLVSLKTPHLVFQTEQEGNGRRLEQLGCGHVIKLSQEEYNKSENNWGYGTYSFLIQNRYDLFPENLYGKVDKVLNDKKYLINAQNLQSKIKQYLGPIKTIELIEKYWP